MSSLSYHIAELSSDGQEDALRLALGELEEGQFRAQAAGLLEAEKAALPTRLRLWGAFHDGKLAGALIMQIPPGRSAMLWPPRVAAGEPPAVAAQLLDEALRALDPREIHVVQALPTSDAGTDSDLLRAAGFRHFSDLLYLVCLADQFPAVAQSSRLQFRQVREEEQERLAATVEATYEATLDCPAVSGLRSMADVLLGYRATGTFEARWWQLAASEGRDVGCLIMADYPQDNLCELVYMGLTPTVRGCGYGKAVVQQALWLAASARRKRLVLGVDAANEPALRVYAAAGFQAWDRKSVFIRVMT